MAAHRTEASATRDDALAVFAREGCSPPRSWANGPGARYGAHDHGYHKVLYCLAGSIVFHVQEDDVVLRAGDRLDLDPGTIHSATVGSDGCECVEASR